MLGGRQVTGRQVPLDRTRLGRLAPDVAAGAGEDRPLGAAEVEEALLGVRPEEDQVRAERPGRADEGPVRASELDLDASDFRAQEGVGSILDPLRGGLRHARCVVGDVGQRPAGPVGRGDVEGVHHVQLRVEACGQGCGAP
jgi:hypothetical protein